MEAETMFWSRAGLLPLNLRAVWEASSSGVEKHRMRHLIILVGVDAPDVASSSCCWVTVQDN